MMPHVALVSMTGFRIREAELLQLGMRLPGFQKRANAVAELPSLGLLTLAGATPEPWTCSYHSVPSALDEERLQAITSQVLSGRPDLVAVSALTASINDAYRLSRELRSHGVRTVIGGLHASVLPDEASQFFDSVVVGRGDCIWAEVLDDASDGRLRSCYDGATGLGAKWPIPRYDLPGFQPRRWTLQTQLGCPLACGFCGASRLLGRFDEKPLSVIRQELDQIRRLSGTRTLELADDNTFAGSRDMDAFLNVMEETGFHWFTESDWRVGERPEILQRLARAGCRQILVGIESLVFRYPGMGEKHAELQRMMEAVCRIQEAGVAVNGCFIIGAEGETKESIDRLCRFLETSPFAEIQVTIQTPFPGTSLYRQLQQEDRLLSDRGWSHYTLFDVTYRPDRLSVRELESEFRSLLQRLFNADQTSRRNKIRRDIMKAAMARSADRPRKIAGGKSW